MIKFLSKYTQKTYSFLIENQFKFYLFIFLLFSAMLLLCEPAAARAGGGGGYSEGGGFSGGSGFSGGGSGGGLNLFFLIYFLFRYPYIGIPVLIIFLIIAYHSSKGVKSGYMTKTIRQGYQNQAQNNISEIISNIKNRDSLFSVENLTERVKNSFIKIQNAWASQDLKNVRQIVSDGIFERFSIQLEVQKYSKIINKMENIQVLNAQLTAAETDHFFDTVHFQLTASASDYYVNSETDKTVYGSTQPEIFTEFWSFLRKPGTKTLTKEGLLEGFCPNCGTPLSISDSVICPSCDAIVNSGEYDWVLAEITQPAEWKIKPSSNVPGMQQMLEKDPAFNIQHIEDKTSVIFYRNIASAFFADKKYIQKLAENLFVEKHKNEYMPDKNSKHSFYADAAIGCAEVIEIKTAKNSNNTDSENSVETSDSRLEEINVLNKDKIRVKVKWAGHPVKSEIPAFIPPNFEENRIYTQEFILARNSGVKSSGKNILSSSHCSNCGAPQTLSTVDKCEYCGAVLNDGSSDWVLEDITFFSGYSDMTHFEALSYKTDSSSPLNKFDNESIIACSAAVMMIDGNITESENGMLKTLAEKHGISNEKLNSIITSIKEHGLHIPNPKSKEEAQEFLKCMVKMCLVDGNVSAQEKQLIKQLLSRTGYSDIDIDQMIKQERNQLYKTAKEVKSKSM